MSDGLRLVVYDVTQKRRYPRALGYSWKYGAHFYRRLDRIDAVCPAVNFAQALAWLSYHRASRPIQELQFWGHGKWGRCFIGQESLDRGVLSEGHEHYAAFRRFRERLTPDALLWFRTCETLGAEPGQDFAAALGDATGARVAGHTFVIGFFQSGLHCLRPGQRPHWSTLEGLSGGTPSQPKNAFDSSPWAPNTITCLDGAIPDGF